MYATSRRQDGRRRAVWCGLKPQPRARDYWISGRTRLHAGLAERPPRPRLRFPSPLRGSDSSRVGDHPDCPANRSRARRTTSSKRSNSLPDLDQPRSRIERRRSEREFILSKTYGQMWLRCVVCRRYARRKLAGLHNDAEMPEAKNRSEASGPSNPTLASTAARAATAVSSR
jgi:hypothetical protein